MGVLRRIQCSSLIAITVFSLLLSCHSLEASFLPSSCVINMRRTVVRPQPALLMLQGGSEEPDEEDETNNSSVTPPPPTPEPVMDVEQAPVVDPPATTTTTTTMIAQGTPGWFRSKFPNLPYHRFPDYLTYLRCGAIPLLCLAFYTPNQHFASAALFAVASFTDWLDGFLARRWKVSTPFGAFLDPVADKLMVSTALVLLSGRHGAMVALPTCVILARELAVSALREWMAQRGLRDTVKVGYQGKIKTALTMVSLTLMLMVPEIVGNSWLGNLFLPSLAALYVSAIITVTSGSVYFRAAAPILMESQ